VRIILFKKARWLGFIVACIVVLSVVVFNFIGYIFNWKYLSSFASAAEINKFEVRSQLLTEAMKQVGVCTPEEAATVWANGLKMRSAALQYSVMTGELKKIYAQQLEKNAPNWVTGMSSPWVQSYKILKVEDTGNDTYTVELVFSTMTSTGPAGDYKAVLSLVREGSFWRIKKISMDEGLFPYTGFSMKKL